MSTLNFFSSLFGGGKRRASLTEREGPREPHLPPLRRLSSSKSGKLKMKKVKSAQNVRDISFSAKERDEERKVDGEPQDESVTVEEVIKEMYEVVQSGTVK